MGERAEPVVRVRGETTLEVEPEIARLTVVVRAQDKDRRRTLERLTERNEACLDLIRRYGEAIEDIDTSALVISPELREGRGERIKGYRGAVRVRVTVRAFEVLGELITRLGDEEMTAVEGPRWELRPGSKVYERAAEQAARAAVDRAKVYARALGTEITGLVELADAGLSSTLAHHGPYAAASDAVMQTARYAMAEPPALALEPETIVVRAVAEATFLLAPPRAL